MRVWPDRVRAQVVLASTPGVSQWFYAIAYTVFTETRDVL